jgi:hypothetical protein
VITTLVKGCDDGENARDFAQWLLPFDDVLQALEIEATPLASGELELRSPGLVLRIPPDAVQIDPDLGRVWSIETLQNRLGIAADFNRLDYAVQFDVPWLGLRQRDRQSPEQPIVTEGLPTLSPTGFSWSGVTQQLTTSGSFGENGDVQTRGAFNTVGTAFGGSWYMRIDQPAILDAATWRLSEFQYLRQGDASDYVLGSQPTFWRSQSQNSDYWGTTYVKRWGFEPPAAQGAGGFNPGQRLQADTVGRTIAGEAAPGTLVQLTLNQTVIAEALVDSSGVYRFAAVPTGNGGASNYRVLLYANGQLTESPEVRAANFSTLLGQLPAHASAVIASGGFNRQPQNQFIGGLGEFRGGVAYRRGITESLTLGAGLIQDVTPQVLAEAFYLPSGLPLKGALSVLTDLETATLDITADIEIRPTPDLYFNLNSDSFAQRFNAEWAVLQGVTLIAQGNTRDRAIAGGVQFGFGSGNSYTLGKATLDTQNRLRWTLNSRLGALGLQHYSDEITTQAQLSYNLSGNLAYGDGHQLVLDYQTRNLNGAFNRLGTFSWRYRSAQRSADGNPRWDIELGYGLGSQGRGLVASLTTAVLPGLDLRARYQGISTISDRSTFQIELLPRLGFQNGINFASERQDWLRTQGGLFVQPFFDQDGDGVKDADEPVYLENLDLLIAINHHDFAQYRPYVSRDGVFFNLPPDRYRIDLDPAGYPLDWQAKQRAYAVEAIAGQYTQVPIPLALSYTLIGVVTDASGTAVAGQRVEAIPIGSDQRTVSVTNAAGVFYLEGLPQGDYRFEMGGEPVDGASLTLDASSEPFQEVNFQRLPSGIEMQHSLPATGT